MIELPEANVLGKQSNDILQGKKVKSVVAGLSPHKFAWFFGEPLDYEKRLKGKTIGMAGAYGGLLEIKVDNMMLLFGDGVSLKYNAAGELWPKKHQLLVEFEDSSFLTGSVQMYGGLWCFKEGEFDNPYYKVAKEKTSPLSPDFKESYFQGMADLPEHRKLSAKAFLATEQRIPGLGNGVLQDILYNAGIHPKRKMETCTEDEIELLFDSVKSTLRQMTEQGGRDTEKDLFGKPGGYGTKLSKNTVGKPCPKCGQMIVKQAYMGGSIYFCEGCQAI